MPTKPASVLELVEGLSREEAKAFSKRILEAAREIRAEIVQKDKDESREAKKSQNDRK